MDALPIAYAELNEAGVFTRANRRACLLLQLQKEEIVGSCVWDIVAADELKMSRESFFAAMHSRGELPPIRRTLYSGNGGFRVYDLHRSRIHDARGRPIGLRYAAIDVTESRLALEEAQQARTWLESVMHSVAQAVIVTDALGFIRLVNPAAEEISGWAARDLTGRAFERKVPILAYQPSDNIPFSHRIGIERQCKGIATFLSREHKEVKVEMTTSPVIDKGTGSVSGVVVLLRKADGTR
jgi:PAS domain S-box-containing protein